MFDTTLLEDINVKLSLKHGWCTTTEILDYLSRCKVTVESLIIYNDVCIHQPDGNHYLSDGHHFLKNAYISYQCLYLMRNLPLDVSLHETNELANLIRSLFNLSLECSTQDRKTWVSEKLSTKDLIKLQSITGLIEKDLTWELFAYFIQGNNIPSKALADGLFENATMTSYIFERDLFEVMFLMIHLESYNHWLKTWYDRIIKRLRKIKRWNNDYYQIILSYYRSVFLKLLDLFMPDYEDIPTLQEFFTDIVEFKDLGHNSLNQAILKLPTLEEQAYVLGLPIYMIKITPRLIFNILKEVDREGIDEYCRNHTQRFRQSIQHMFPLMLIEEEDLVTGDSLFSYNAFDVVPYVSNQRVYLYSRDEAGEIMEKKKDHFNEPVNEFFITQMVSRQKQAIQFNLGRAQPVSYNLRRLIDNTKKEKAVPLFEKQNLPIVPIASGTVNLNQVDMTNLFNQLMNF